MGKYSIVGGRSLCGEVKVQGSKNAVLPVLAATILNKGKTYIYNCPKIEDVFNMIKILQSIGCMVLWEEDLLIVDAMTLHTDRIPDVYVQTMRSSIIVLGSVLGRLKSATISFPGGCSIGVRPIDLHIRALKQMNIQIEESNGFLKCKTQGIVGNTINLDFPSVGATENIMLASVLSSGTTRIYGAAKEPEIYELQCFLNTMGARVQGAGTDIITIEGVSTLKDATYTIMPDRIVAGTYLVAAAITGGEIMLNNVQRDHIGAICSKLQEMGCYLRNEPAQRKLYIKSPKELRAVNIIRTQPYPGFPTDMQAQIMACLCLARGTTILSETIFESRFKHVPELKKMGADIMIENHLAVVKGVEKLHGAEVFAEDLRGGAALILAGLAAEGVTIVKNSTHVERGYEHIEETLNGLGAQVTFEA